jgi:two-component system, cell cycle sensor histidine kinase and response regulator CckA
MDIPKNDGETILLVEDDSSLRAMVGYLLRWQGYQVLEAPDPAAAQALAENFADPIHLLLTDVNLPQTNGYELARRLLALRPIPAVLFVSGEGGTDTTADRTLSATQGFLLKPFGPQALAVKIRELLNVASPHPSH